MYYTPEQVALKLQLNVATIYRYLRNGKLRGVHLSLKVWRISEKDLLAFMGG